MADYAGELRRQIEAVIEMHPDLEHRREQPDRITFPAADAGGFDIRVFAECDRVTVFAGDVVHVHFEEPPVEAVRDALGLVRNLLSPDMRLRERCAAGRAHRGTLERQTQKGWAPEATTVLLLWNWFGRRSERVRRNSQLPGRLLGSAEPVSDADAAR